MAQPAHGQQAARTADSSGYVAANGVDYWFEIHGKGEPCCCCTAGSVDGHVRSHAHEAGRNRRVIGVDLHGHGRTALGNQEDHASSTSVATSPGGPEARSRQVDVMGYLFGGGAALQLAAQHPTLVRRLVLVSAPYAQNGFFPEMLPQQAAVGAAMADAMKETPMYKSYAAIAPQPAGFPAAARRDGRVHAHSPTTGRRREEAADAGDARLRRRRHGPPRAHRLSSTSCSAVG